MTLKRTTRNVLAALGLGVAFAALADPGKLDFDDLPDGVKLDASNNFIFTYLGEYKGVDFTDQNAHAVLDSDDGGVAGNFENNPSKNTALTFQIKDNITLNIKSGFSTLFSLWYSASSLLTEQANIKFYSDLNGTGDLLEVLYDDPNDLIDSPVSVEAVALPSNYSLQCPIGTDPKRSGDFCNWDEVVALFSPGDIAKSVVFSGGANQITYDDITFGVANGGGNVPEPGSLALVGAALLGLSAARRRKT